MKTAVMQEKDWQRTLVDLLRLYGWRVCEFRKARIKKDGQDVYRTPFGADGKGMTDLIAIKPPRVAFIENKTERGRLSPEQIIWRELLTACPGVEYYLAKPSDFEQLKEVLR